jgi:hypothetical protein
MLAPKRRGWTRMTIEMMQVIALGRGGRCLSKTYENVHSNLEWECVKKHRWHATPNNVKRGAWCGICAIDATRGSLSDILKIVEQLGGRCLSDQYVNVAAPLQFECGQGHRWQSSAKTVLEGHWCMLCFHDSQRSTLQEMRELAASRDGQCLSDAYLNNYNPLRWRCAHGHEWKSNPLNIRKHWCPECGDDKRRLGIARMREIAVELRGILTLNLHLILTHPEYAIEVR